MDQSQSLSKGQSSTSSSDNKDFEQHIDQQEKRGKMENEKTTN